MGAIAAGGVEVLSTDLIRDLGIPHALVQQVAVRERLELERRDGLFRGGRQPLPVRDRTIILVDDGLATGSTMQAAIIALRQHAPAQDFRHMLVGRGIGAKPESQEERIPDKQGIALAFKVEPSRQHDHPKTPSSEIRFHHRFLALAFGITKIASNDGVSDNQPCIGREDKIRQAFHGFDQFHVHLQLPGQ